MKNNKNQEFRIKNQDVIIFNYIVLILMSCVLTLSSCDDDDEIIAPKPKAYFRITLPEKTYKKYDTICPYTFEFPSYAKAIIDKDANSEPCWLNLEFPAFKSTLHLSYKSITKNNFKAILDDTYTLASKHQVKASGIKEQLIKRDSSKVYGLIYDIQGNAASSFQFFITDSTNHFMRGALYFNAVPNTDSIAPVVEFIKKDIYHFINTFEWKYPPPELVPETIKKILDMHNSQTPPYEKKSEESVIRGPK